MDRVVRSAWVVVVAAVLCATMTTPALAVAPHTAETDEAPWISGTSPTAGETDVSLATPLIITFTEPVNVASNALGLVCTLSGTHTVQASGGPTIWSFQPDVPFQPGESCTASLPSAAITDQDLSDPPDQLLADYSWLFSTTTDVRAADLAIRKTGEATWVGEGILGDATGQTRKVSIRPGRSAKFDVMVTNAGHPESDDITVGSVPVVGARGLKATFFHGPVNVTDEVYSGGVECPALAPAASDFITIKIRATPTARGSLSVLVDGIPTLPGTTDSVMAKVRVRG